MSKHSFRFLLLFVAVAFLGVLSTLLLPVGLVSYKTDQTLSIHFDTRNSSPELTELLITSKLESTLSVLGGIRRIESASGYNSGYVILHLERGTDIDFIRLEVNAIVRRLYTSFPADTSYPYISLTREVQNQMKPLLVFTFSAPFAPAQIKKVIENLIAKDITRIKGVSELRISGAEDRQLLIMWEPSKAETYKLGAQVFRRTIQQQFVDLSLGSASVSGTVIHPLVLKQQAEKPVQLNQMKYLLPDGRSIPFNLLGKVVEEDQSSRQFFRVNGLNSVNLMVYAHESENQIHLSDEILATVLEASKSLPPRLKVITEYDDTEYLRNELAKITKRALIALVLLMLAVLLSHREWGYMLILLSGVLIALLLTSLVIFVVGLELHLYSIAGLTISFGLVIDNALIMTDHLRKKGNSKVFVALFGACLTTIAALMVVFLLPEEYKDELTDFSAAVCIALGNSLLVALFYMPAAHELLSEKFRKSATMSKLKKNVRVFNAYSEVLTVLFRFREIFIIALILWFGLPIFWLPTKWEEQNWYNRTVGNQIYQEHVRPWVDRMLGGTLRMFVQGVFENSSYRSPKKTYLYISATLPYGHTLEQMDRVIRRMEEYLKSVEGVDKFITRVVSGEAAFITITFLPDREFSSLPHQLKSQLINKAIDLGGVKWSVYGVGQGFSNRSTAELPSFRVLLKGYNYKELECQAHLLAARLLANSRIKEVETDGQFDFFERTSQEFLFRLDPKKATKIRIPVQTVISKVTTFSPPLGPSFYLPFSDRVMPVYLLPKDADEFSVYDFKERYYYADNFAFQMKQVGSLEFRKVRNTIRKENRQYLRMVSFDYFGSHHFGSRYLDQVLDEMKPAFPPGYTAEWIDSNRSWDEAQRQYGLLLVLLAVIYWICAILFESFKQPFYILLTIPVSFIGLLGAFAWFDLYFDQGGYAAFILLGGLVVNSAIFIINDFNNEKKYSNNRRIMKAAAGKFFPISMTILSTCLGLVPFLMDGQNEVFWFSLAAGTIGGLLMSFIAVFLLVPVLMMKKINT